jgi:hypothetical protein
MRADRYAAYGLGEADEKFRRAVRDGFRGAGLSHQQFLDALTWYQGVRAGGDEATLFASFHDFATAKGWPVENLVAAQGVYQAIQQSGPEAVIATPTPEEDQATIAKANELLARDSAAYFAGELPDLLFEALERQEAALSSPAIAPPSDVEIEQRIARQDMAKFETMMRTDPQRYWSSPELQAAYRDSIHRATTSPAPIAPAVAPTPTGQPSPVAPAPSAEPATAAPAPVEPRSDAAA